MINGMLDGLEHHDDDRRIVSSSLKMKDAIQLLVIRLLYEREQRLSRSFRTLPQLVKAWEMRQLLKQRGRDFSGQGLCVAFFRVEQMHERLSYAAKRSYHGRVQLCVG